MEKGQTVLIQNDKAKGNIARNYQPITCLSLILNLLKGISVEEIYEYLEKKMLLSKKQNGCRRKCKETSDLLFIDK